MASALEQARSERNVGTGLVANRPVANQPAGASEMLAVNGDQQEKADHYPSKAAI